MRKDTPYDPAAQPHFKAIRQAVADIFAEMPANAIGSKRIQGRDLLCRLAELGHVDPLARAAVELMEDRGELFVGWLRPH